MRAGDGVSHVTGSFRWKDYLVTLRAAFIYYLFMGGVGLSALAQIVNFIAGWPTRNLWRWIALALGIVAVLSLAIAGQMGKKDLQWRRVDDSQEAILSQKLAGTHAEGHFLVSNWQDPEQGQYYMSIAGVCIKLQIVCYLHILKGPYPDLFPLPGMLSFAFEDADHTFINAFTAAGLITGRVGTLFGTEVFPEGIRAGIIIGPKPSPLGPEAWRTNAPEPR
jgi:hypothetical protein